MRSRGLAPIMRTVNDGSPAHRIADELRPDWLDEWIASGIEEIEDYLAKHAAFLRFLDGESQLA
jgi:hypothetical protein